MRPSGDTARGLVFDDFVDKQVVHVSVTSFRSGVERVSMNHNVIIGLIYRPPNQDISFFNVKVNNIVNVVRGGGGG